MSSKIGIITWHNYPNFGSALQAYALHRYINALGGDVRIIDYAPEKPRLWRIRLVLSFFDQFIPKKAAEKFHYRFLSFECRYFRKTRRYVTIESLAKTNRSFDIFICGSDQIWAPNVFREIYMLSFVEDAKKKLSYAASIGLPEIPVDLQPVYNRLLKRFDRISVREKQGRDLLSLIGIDATVVLDPTFLFAKEHWIKLAKMGRKRTGPYILCYFLGQTERHRKMAEAIAAMKEYSIVCLSRFEMDKRPSFITDSDAGPREFIGYVSNAALVITDSFHGLCFSINLNRDFYVVNRFEDGDAINQNSRIEHILTALSLEARLITRVPDMLEPIDYAPVNRDLERLRNVSRQFLKDAIGLEHE